MDHDINLNIHYTAPAFVWDKIGEVYRSMPYWYGNENGSRWVGSDIDLYASAEPSGIQIAGIMPDEIWVDWYASLKQKLKDALNHEIGEPEDGVEFYKFIPRDMGELYWALQKEDLKGTLEIKDDWLVWRLPNNIILKIYIWNPPHEGYIAAYYSKNGKERPLTHWHPMDDEVYRDLIDINNGWTVWVKTKTLFGENIIIMDRNEYETMSDKEKRKVSILE